MSALRVVSVARALSTLIVALGLAGCASGTTGSVSPFAAPDNSHLSPAERELRASVRDRRILEAVATGCLATGGMTLAWNLVTGASAETMARDAAIGCFAGGVVGAAYGAYVDARAQSYADEQSRIAALQRAAQADLDHYRKLNAATENLIAEERTRIAEAKAQQAAAEAAVAGTEAEAARRDDILKLLSSARAEVDGNIQTMDGDRQELVQRGVDVAVLDPERAALAHERDELDKRIEVLKEIYQQPA